MDYKDKFNKWLSASLKQKIPKSVVAFSFNLMEYPIGFGVELIGAEAFDSSDSDWACEECFEPKERSIEICPEFSGDNWETCLSKVKELIKEYMASDQHGASVLKSKEGVGVGFVDGDMHILWEK